MRLEWSPLALNDRDGIFDYIAPDNPRAAVVMDKRIGEQIKRLTQFSSSGRVGRVEGTRELVIRRTPYIAVYRLTGGTARILRIVHSAQLWPDAITD